MNASAEEVLQGARSLQRSLRQGLSGVPKKYHDGVIFAQDEGEEHARILAAAAKDKSALLKALTFRDEIIEREVLNSVLSL